MKGRPVVAHRELGATEGEQAMNRELHLITVVVGLFGLGRPIQAPRIEGLVGPFGSRVHRVHMGPGDRWLTVRGGNNSDIDCRLLDTEGRLVDADTDGTSYCILEVAVPGDYSLEVQNMGGRTNRYTVQQRRSL